MKDACALDDKKGLGEGGFLDLLVRFCMFGSHFGCHEAAIPVLVPLGSW